MSWSPPDAHGIRTQSLDVGAKVTLRGRRLRRAFPEQPSKLDALPADWRGVLLLWAKREGERVKWDTLQKLAGHANYQPAHELLESLLRGGWVQLEERRKERRWLPIWINFLHLGRMQEALGLPRRDDLVRRFEEETARPFHDLRLAGIAAPLAQQPPQRALDRLALLRALDRWIDEQRFGTRRDFALYARGGTKSLSEAEWEWLDARLDLAGLGVQRHTPALWLRAPFTLCRGEQRLDLRAVPDCIALTPAMIERCIAMEGAIRHWRVGGEPHELRARRPPLRRRGCRAVGARFRSELVVGKRRASHHTPAHRGSDRLRSRSRRNRDRATGRPALGRGAARLGALVYRRSNPGGAPKHEAARK